MKAPWAFTKRSRDSSRWKELSRPPVLGRQEEDWERSFQRKGRTIKKAEPRAERMNSGAPKHNDQGTTAREPLPESRKWTLIKEHFLLLVHMCLAGLRNYNGSVTAVYVSFFLVCITEMTGDVNKVAWSPCCGWSQTYSLLNIFEDHRAAQFSLLWSSSVAESVEQKIISPSMFLSYLVSHKT